MKYYNPIICSLDFTMGVHGSKIRVILRGGSQRLLLMSVETMGFDIFIITQITYVIVTFKSTIPTCSRAHIAHISVPTSFKCLCV